MIIVLWKKHKVPKQQLNLKIKKHEILLICEVLILVKEIKQYLKILQLNKRTLFLKKMLEQQH
jgi:hypothetical protein